MLPAAHTHWFGQEPAENGEVEVGDRDYALSELQNSNEGLRLWPCAVMLAREVAARDLAGLRVCEVGAGLGLPGMVAANGGAAVKWIDKQRAVCDHLRVMTFHNLLRGRIETANWSEWARGRRPFDCILGSEVLYPNYGLPGLADFIDGNWTGKGPCLFVNSKESGEFATALCQNNLSAATSGLCGTHPDGRPLTVTLWTISRR